MYYTHNILLVFKKILPLPPLHEAFEVFHSTFSDADGLNGRLFYHHSRNSSFTSENLDGQAG